MQHPAGPLPYAHTGADDWWAIAPVRSYPANGFGLYEVSGSVWDRCSDRFAADYCARSPHQDPQGSKEGARRVMRGGPGKRSEDVLSGHGSQNAEPPTKQEAENHVHYLERRLRRFQPVLACTSCSTPPPSP
ncbi:SUMF1/EgtB/PvdO family nonheme iron enzyme [Streptomyces sp. NPDC097704]|uniref:formylglycine-generating enzyme family protein n=1 Tax=Streptomyces sp. NPDC097704 TaxID=3157101 RepID=UPI00332CC710